MGIRPLAGRGPLHLHATPRYTSPVRRSDAYLEAILEEIRNILDAGGMDERTGGERAALRREIAEVIVELREGDER